MEYGGDGLEFAVSQSWFENLVAPFVDRAIRLLKAALHEALLNQQDVGAIIVIGGTSHLKLLHQRLLTEESWKDVVEFSQTPEWDVAHGAAVVSSLPGGYELADSVGLILSDERFHPLVSPGDRAFKGERSISLALVEDVSEANVVIAKQSSNRTETHDPVLQFSVPVGGFDGERVFIDYSITPDLILNIKGRSSTRGTLRYCEPSI